MATTQLSLSATREKLKAIFMGVGVPEQDAANTADSLLDAELSGVESHGLMRLKPYVDRIVQKNINPDPDIQMEIHDAIIKVDGKNGLGQVVTTKTVDVCIDLARKHGIAIAAIGHSNHFGTAGFYTTRMAREGCIGFVASAASPTMAPFGGMDLLLGTNPFSVSFPGKEQIFCSDIATSAVAKGKIRIYEQKGLSIPTGWALDAEGNDTTDPTAAIQGILLPMGAHKGYALAMVVDALCGMLSGSKLSCESVSMFQADQPADTAHFVAAVDIAHFLPLEEFRLRTQAWFDRLHNSATRPGFSRILIPGELEAEKRSSAGDSLHVLEKTAAVLETYYQTYGK